MKGKLTDLQRVEICRRYIGGESSLALASAYNIAPQNIRALLRKKEVAIRANCANGKLSKVQIADAVVRYQSGESTLALGREFGIHPDNIGKLLKRRGIELRGSTPKGRRKLQDTHVQDVCTSYISGESQKGLAKRLGVSRGAVLNVLKSEGVQIRDAGEAVSAAARKYTLNHDFFREIDAEEKAYWLGFAAADGCVYRTRFQVGLAEKDTQHLYLLAKHLGSNSPLQFGPGRSTLVVSSIQLTTDLTRLGLGPRKTFTHPWPHNLSDEMKRHFLRGYLDGDGTWHRKKNESSSYFSIVSHTAFLLDAQNFLMEMCNLRQTKLSPHEKTEGIGRLFYSGNKQVARIAQFLYKDATVFLPRKRAIVESFLQ